jgi:hypothetical protein
MSTEILISTHPKQRRASYVENKGNKEDNKANQPRKKETYRQMKIREYHQMKNT